MTTTSTGLLLHILVLPDVQGTVRWTIGVLLKRLVVVGLAVHNEFDLVFGKDDLLQRIFLEVWLCWLYLLSFHFMYYRHALDRISL